VHPKFAARFLIRSIYYKITAPGLLLLLVGCSSVDISNRDPFYDYVGRTVELRQPVAVVVRRAYWKGGDGVMARRSASYGLVTGNGQGYGRVFSTLPAGHTVRINSVWDEVAGDGQQIVAYGHTTIPPSTNEVSFAYPWGLIWTLYPAPWEPETTPKLRGPPGRLPPHFDYEMFRPPPDAPKWGTKVKGQ
jgi:hypothetical protein